MTPYGITRPQWVKLGHQDISPSNGHQGNMTYHTKTVTGTYDALGSREMLPITEYELVFNTIVAWLPLMSEAQIARSEM